MDFLYCDSHLHLASCIQHGEDFSFVSEYSCSCAHSEKDYYIQNKTATELKSSEPVWDRKVLEAFGIFPLDSGYDGLYFLEQLLRTEKLDAIGETGFDFFSKEARKSEKLQTFLFHTQIELAVEYDMPVIIHCRKGMEKIFSEKNKLAKLKSVIFHSFPGSANEFDSLLKKGINAYAGFGKNIVNGSRKYVECLKKIPCERILLETDAPFCCKENHVSSAAFIRHVYSAFFSIKSEEIADITMLCNIIQSNFCNAFCIDDK